MKALIFAIVFMATGLAHGASFVVDTVGGAKTLFTAAAPTEPSRGQSYADPSTGLIVTRLTDVLDVVPKPGVNTGLPWPVNGNPKGGFYNGYSRFSNVNATGEYMIAFRTNNHSSLYRLTDGAYLGPVVPDANHAIGESAEIRWDRSGRSGTATRIYYHFDSKFFQQDALLGYPSAQLIYDFAGVGIPSTGDMDSSNDARYWALKLGSGKCVVLDAYNKVVLPGQITQAPNGLDISPSGKWFVVVTSSSDPARGFRFYRISDLTAGDTTKPVYLPTARAGHNCWAYDASGAEVLVYQDNNTDWFCAFDPEAGRNVQIVNLSECGYGMNQHIGRMSNPAKKGWALFSTYSSDNGTWSYNQLFMLEIKPVEQHPRIWRLCSTFNTDLVNGVDVGGYFAEAFASIDPAGNNVYWGGNWNATDNLEVYRVALPSGWHEALAPADPGAPYRAVIADLAKSQMRLLYNALIAVGFTPTEAAQILKAE